MPATRAARRQTPIAASAAISKDQQDDPYAFDAANPAASSSPPSSSRQNGIAAGPGPAPQRGARAAAAAAAAAAVAPQQQEAESELEELSQIPPQLQDEEDDQEEGEEEVPPSDDDQQQQTPAPFRRRTVYVSEHEEEDQVEDGEVVVIRKPVEPDAEPESEAETQPEEQAQEQEQEQEQDQNQDQDQEQEQESEPEPEPEPERKSDWFSSRGSSKAAIQVQGQEEEDEPEEDDMPLDGGDHHSDKDWHEGDKLSEEEDGDDGGGASRKSKSHTRTPRQSKSRTPRRSPRSSSSRHVSSTTRAEPYQLRHAEQVSKLYQVDEKTQAILQELKAERLRKERVSRLRRSQGASHMEQDYADIQEGGAHTANLVEFGDEEPVHEDDEPMMQEEQEEHSDDEATLHRRYLNRVAHEQTTPKRAREETPRTHRRRRKSRTPGWKPGQARIIKSGNPVEVDVEPDELDESLAEMDDFVVGDESVEYVEDGPKRKRRKKRHSKKRKPSSDDDSDEDSPLKAGAGWEAERTAFAKLANRRDEEETQDFVHGLRSRNRTMDEEEAFNLWLEYLGSVLIDPRFSQEVETGKKDLETKFRYKTAIRQIEQQFNTTTNEWVMSKLWTNETPEARYFRNALNHLPYVESSPQDDPTRPFCNICSGRKHGATHKIKFYGYRYRPDSLKHPWDKKEIIDGISVEGATFALGTICHGRVRLYHAMKHYKFHVMASMKKRFDAYDVNPGVSLDSKLHRLLHEDPTWKKYHYDIWKDLKSFAEPFVNEDTRAVHVDVDYLNDIQSPEDEVILPELFSYHAQRFSLRKAQRAKDKMKKDKKKKENEVDEHEQEEEEEDMEVEPQAESDVMISDIESGTETEAQPAEDGDDKQPIVIDDDSSKSSVPELEPNSDHSSHHTPIDVDLTHDPIDESTPTTPASASASASAPSLVASASTPTSTSTSTSSSSAVPAIAPSIDVSHLVSQLAALAPRERAKILSQYLPDGPPQGVATVA